MTTNTIAIILDSRCGIVIWVQVGRNFFSRKYTAKLMYMVVFGGIAGISTDGLPQPLFYNLKFKLV